MMLVQIYGFSSELILKYRLAFPQWLRHIFSTSWTFILTLRTQPLWFLLCRAKITILEWPQPGPPLALPLQALYVQGQAEVATLLYHIAAGIRGSGVWFPRSSSLISCLLHSCELLRVASMVSFPWKDSDLYSTLTTCLILFHSLRLFAGVISSGKSSLITPPSSQPTIALCKWGH